MMAPSVLVQSSSSSHLYPMHSSSLLRAASSNRPELDAAVFVVSELDSSALVVPEVSSETSSVVSGDSWVAVWVMAPLSALSSLDASVEQEANARAETASAVIATDLFMSPSSLTQR